ncbi:MAG: SMI1/KNR4 family protein [Herpetosiphonaceae bacterium]|nr:SMI1/KNR4 family protein [Herpetosiphonaceae bacterium]
MSLHELISDPTALWERCPPASEAAIQALVEHVGVQLPDEYLALLRYSNGGEGELGIEPLWFSIFPAEEVLQSNQDHALATYLPGYLAFGSNLGLEILLFNTKEGHPWKVYYVPNIGMDERDVLESAPDLMSGAVI